MTEEQLRANIAKNITELRKASNITQADLAEKLNYSDKSISKWERGDGVPEIMIAAAICPTEWAMAPKQPATHS